MFGSEYQRIVMFLISIYFNSCEEFLQLEQQNVGRKKPQCRKPPVNNNEDDDKKNIET